MVSCVGSVVAGGGGQGKFVAGGGGQSRLVAGAPSLSVAQTKISEKNINIIYFHVFS